MRCSSVVFLLAFSLSAFSQNQNSDSTLVENERHSLILGAGYGSNMRFPGIKLMESQPYLSSDLTYAYNNLLTANVALYHLPGIQPSVAFYDFSLGIAYTFNSYFDAALTLSRYCTANQLKETFFDNANYISASAGLDWRLIYTNVSYSAMLASESQHYLRIANSHYLPIKQLKKGRGQFWIDPSVNFILSSYYSESSSDGNGNGNKPSQEEETIQYDQLFGLTELEISLPMAVDFGKATLEVNPYYSVEIKKDALYPASSGFCLYINLYIKLK